ncbi:MAG: putative lipid II flippase FtsW [Deltaproteobacteria bacterium]|nr:putative lipid II flippase FtsW [Deltaproteobacteria bacterium]
MGILFRRKRIEGEGDEKGKKEYRPFDVYLLFVTLFLVFIGLVMVFSSSAVLARERYQDGYFFLKKEILFVFIGILAMLGVRKIPYRVYWKSSYWFLLVALVPMVLVLFVGSGGGQEEVRRWIRVGPFSFQPSEPVKLAVVVFCAYALAKKGEKIKNFARGFLPVISISGVYIGLILLQKDLGSAFVLGLVVFLMLFISGTRLSYLAGASLATIPVLYYLLFSVGFRRQRMLAFLDPWKYQLGTGFQIIQSFVAFQSGGLTGVGLGEGKQKLFYLPEAHTDFIFSVVGEELGLLGVMGVVTLFTIFVFRGLIIAFRCRDLFGVYLAFGLTCLVGLQAFVNIGVVMGLLPTKGLTLPFISYGGTSLITSMVTAGILLNISADEGEEF